MKQYIEIEYKRGKEHSFFVGTPEQVLREKKRLISLGYVVNIVNKKDAKNIENTGGNVNFIESK